MKNFFINLLVGAAALCAYSTSLYAQTGEDFFHQAAAFYINGNLPEARRAVETGIKRDPTNPKLKTLRNMLEEEESQQQQQQQNQQQQDQQEKQQGQQQDQQQKDRQQQDQQKRDEPQQQQAKEQKADKDQMKKEDAARLLEALKNQEKDAQKQRQMKVQGRARVDKDW